MKILNTAILEPVRYLPSPHYNERPNNIIDMVVVHGISLPPGRFGEGHIERFFCGTLDITAHTYFQSIFSLKVSSHLLIDRKGEITQFVPFDKRAWHAGESVFNGKKNCNDFSIGIELEGTDDIPYEKSQYTQLADMIKLLRRAYPAITPERIVGHNKIAPHRKTDPGNAFDWEFLRNLLEGKKEWFLL